jgi:predicted transcriptional regulator
LAAPSLTGMVIEFTAAQEETLEELALECGLSPEMLVKHAIMRALEWKAYDDQVISERLDLADQVVFLTEEKLDERLKTMASVLRSE